MLVTWLTRKVHSFFESFVFFVSCGIELGVVFGWGCFKVQISSDELRKDLQGRVVPRRTALCLQEESLAIFVVIVAEPPSHKRKLLLGQALIELGVEFDLVYLTFLLLLEYFVYFESDPAIFLYPLLHCHRLNLLHYFIMLSHIFIVAWALADFDIDDSPLLIVKAHPFLL